MIYILVRRTNERMNERKNERQVKYQQLNCTCTGAGQQIDEHHNRYRRMLLMPDVPG